MTEKNTSFPNGDPVSPLASPITRALLEELLGKLTALAQEGRDDCIDLLRLPLPPGALEALRAWLGRGEIEATVRALGTTTITETAIAGIWWVRQSKADGSAIGETLEIALCPALLTTDASDVAQSTEQLRRRMESLVESDSMKSSESADPR